MAARVYRPTFLIIFIFAGLLLSLALFSPGLAQNGDIQEGAALYQENCQVCHGEQGQGRVGATLSKNWPSIRPDLTIRNVIANGVPGSPMPAWSSDKGGPLSEDQVDSLVAYILSWETGEPFELPRVTPTARPAITPLPDLEGDPNRGAVLYDKNCSVCHGAEGLGRVGATLAKNWSAIRPSATIGTVISMGVDGSPMPAWGQAYGGPLTEQEIADVTAFILTLPHVQTSIGAPTPAAPTPTTALSGVTGVVVTIILFTLIVALILFAQRREPQS